ncbi:MAG: glycogen synthase GlgA [Clostridia bacterium]|nr:glycogen synthase GlgA [Clostridia bacterium]
MKKILIVGAEAVPFASTGGLGDVMGSLPAALAEQGDVDIRAVMPLYSAVSADFRTQMRKVCEFTVHLSWRQQYCGVYEYKKGAATYYFLDNEYYFKRPALYGQYDDGERFAFFSHAVLDMLPLLDFFPDVLHANDWQAALAVIYLKQKYNADPRFADIKTVYTIHNIDYQGIYDLAILGDVFDLPESARGVVEFDGCINLTKGAIVCCDRLTTVSCRYAEELQSPYFSGRLSAIICQYAHKTSGIVNGIDLSYYNPTNDPDIKFSYSVDDRTGKAENKTELQRILGLPESATTPVIAMVSRLASHKGFDLVRCVLEEMLQWDIQFVLLGTGEAALEDYFTDLANRYPSKVGVVLAFNKALSKQIYAGADMFLMPSKSEPCGLSQMIASVYGAVPIVREIGGLYDTIKPFNPETGEGNGITFVSYNAHDMMDAVRRAISLYENGDLFATMTYNAMTHDFSWSASAKGYLGIYNTL